MDSIELENRLRLLVEAAGYRLVLSHWKPMRGKLLLRVVADAEDRNITVGECAALSRSISDLLDSYPGDFPDYRLEVSLPGLDHPLEPWQIRKNLGRWVEVQYLETNQVVSWRGELVSVDEAGIRVRCEDQIRDFSSGQFRQIKVLPRF